MRDWVKNVASESPLVLSHHSSCCPGRLPAVFGSAGMCSSLGSLLWLYYRARWSERKAAFPSDCRGWVCKAKSCSQRTLTFVLVTIEWILNIFQAQRTENVQLCSADPQPVQLSCISTADTSKLFPCSLKDFCYKSFHVEVAWCSVTILGWMWSEFISWSFPNVIFLLWSSVLTILFHKFSIFILLFSLFSFFKEITVQILRRDCFVCGSRCFLEGGDKESCN